MPDGLEHADLLSWRLRWVFEVFSAGRVGASAVARHGLSVASTIYFRVAGRRRVPQRTRLWRRGRPTRRGQRRARCGTLPSIDVSGGLDGCPRSCVPIEICWVKIRAGARERASLWIRSSVPSTLADFLLFHLHPTPRATGSHGIRHGHGALQASDAFGAFHQGLRQRCCSGEEREAAAARQVVYRVPVG